MKTFDHILNWKLLAGSHGFPGPDGGTCINEAAIVAAGFEYREIKSASDCPPCFSRPIAAYAIGINDKMPDGLRQELLMPFVTRLAGTADDRKIETKRVAHIAIQTVRRILPIILRPKFAALADQCAAVSTLIEARAAADAAYAANAAADAANAAAYAANAAAYAAYAANAAADAAAYAAYAANAAADAAYAANAAAYAADAAYAANAAAYAADAADSRRTIWREAVAILDEAINLGRQADDLDIGLVVERMKIAKACVAETAGERRD